MSYLLELMMYLVVLLGVYALGRELHYTWRRHQVDRALMRAVRERLQRNRPLSEALHQAKRERCAPDHVFERQRDYRKLVGRAASHLPERDRPFVHTAFCQHSQRGRLGYMYRILMGATRQA